MKVMHQLNRLAAGTAIVAFAAFAGVGLAQADGMRGKRVVYEKPWDWGGFYFGVHSGWQWSDHDATFLSGDTFSVSQDAQVVGGQIGLQHQFGHVVLGVEGNFTAALRDTYENTTCPTPLFNCGVRFNDVLTVGPRLGYAMGKWMPYVTGGYASARFEERLTTIVATGPVTFADGGSRHDGWYIGAGVDMALSHGWTIGLEYRHYEFDAAFAGLKCTGAVPIAVGAIPACPQHSGTITPGGITLDPSLDTVTLRVSWKFGRERAVPLK